MSGLCGVGKTTAVNFLARESRGEVIYFGSTVLNAVRERGLLETSENEQIVRIALRRELGNAYLARIEGERMKDVIASGRDVFVDAVYVGEEFEFLSGLVADTPFFLIGIEAPFALRLERLKHRPVRPLMEPQLRERDAVELRKLNTGEVFAKAAVRILNDGSMEQLEASLSPILKFA